MEGVRLVKIVLRLFKEVSEDDISGAATELAYKFFLALFPFLIFMASLGAFASTIFGIENPSGRIRDSLTSALPPDASSVLSGQVDEVVGSKDPTLLSIGIIGSIWAAASGIGTIMKAANRIYEVKETRSHLKRYGIAVGLTLLAGSSIMAAFLIMVIGQVYGMRIADELDIQGATATLFTLARWPLILVLLMSAVAVLFWAAPNVDLPFKWVSPGAILFVIVWLPATFLFGLYVANFGSYNATYGALGGVVVLLIWLYLSSFILLVAEELNAVISQEAAPKELKDRAGEGATAHTAKGGGQKVSDSGLQAEGESSGLKKRLPVVAGAGGAVVTALAFLKARGRKKEASPPPATPLRTSPTSHSAGRLR
jgi:membrane protein